MVTVYVVRLPSLYALADWVTVSGFLNLDLDMDGVTAVGGGKVSTEERGEGEGGKLR